MIERTKPFFIVELLKDYEFKINDRKYYKCERFMVFDFDDEHYSISNFGGEYLLKDNCKILYDVKVVSREDEN